MKYLYLDCDDVLLDTTQMFMDFMRDNYGIVADISQYPHHWDISASPFADFRAAVEAFARSDYFRNIPPRPQAKDGLKALKALGYKLFVVSSCPNDAISEQNRRCCLTRHFGDVFEDVACLSFSFDNKGKYFSSVPKGIVIDDSMFNINKALQYGHEGILIAIKQNGKFQREAKAKNIIISHNLLEVADFLKSHNN